MRGSMAARRISLTLTGLEVAGGIAAIRAAVGL